MRIDVPMKWLGAMLVCLLLAAPLRAQEATLAPSSAQGCLILLPGGPDRPEYPATALERKDGATLTVALEFDSPNARPKLRWLNDNAAQALLEAVRVHVARYRVPCLPTHGGKAVLQQTFVFDPSDGRKVMLSAAEDGAHAKHAEALRCLSHAKGDLQIWIPTLAERNREQGKYFVELEFWAADHAPRLRWLAASSGWRLKAAVADHVEGLRLPCMTGEPVRSNHVFDFRYDRGVRAQLGNMDLRQFLGFAQNVPLPALFDTRNMACPFDLRVRYFQPYAPNLVGELDESDPARRPFLNWLAQVKLKLNEANSLLVLGEQFTLSVPCVRVDL